MSETKNYDLVKVEILRVILEIVCFGIDGDYVNYLKRSASIPATVDGIVLPQPAAMKVCIDIDEASVRQAVGEVLKEYRVEIEAKSLQAAKMRSLLLLTMSKVIGYEAANKWVVFEKVQTDILSRNLESVTEDMVLDSLKLSTEKLRFT